ncbi:peptidogalycan biosysnthesis protein [Streptomyces axinellae]|uniref:BioF2-like acetyltransferase domain-containing protein n=1 Tax=Streptomyces axinellae TaxID=552788 RepID=A0ABN3PSH5_9ACTN
MGEVPPHVWDALVGPDNFYQSHRWLRGVELAHGPDPVLTAWDGNRLVGAVPTWPGEGNEPGLFSLPEMFPDLDTSWSPRYLWLGTRRSVYNELLCARGPIRAEVLQQLLHGALAMAERDGRDGVVLPYLAGDDARELAHLHPRARALLHDADANIDISVGGVAEQLHHASRRDRARRRAELRAPGRTGTTLTWLPLDEGAESEAARLIAQNRQRYGSSAGQEWMDRSFAAQEESGALGRAVGCFALRDGHPLAVTVCYAHHDRLYARYFGFDYAHAKPSGEYFALNYGALIDYAAACGFRRVRLAVSAQQVKVRRGARLAPLAAVVLPAEGEVRTEEAVAAHNHHTVGRWRELCGSRPQAMGTEWDAWETRPPEPPGPPRP